MRHSNRRRDRTQHGRLRGEGNGLAMTQRVRGTARERTTVAAMILVGAMLPIVAKLPLFQDVVWIFWLAAFVLMLGALALVLRIIWRDRRSRES